MFKEFKEFAFKGNVIDMAVGVIIGGAFGKIVTSLVNDLLMPIFGFLLGKISFTSLKWILRPAVLASGGQVLTEEVAIFYGNFLQNVVDFLLIAVCIFLAIRFVNGLRQKKEEEMVEQVQKGPTQEELLTEIRDLLKKDCGNK